MARGQPLDVVDHDVVGVSGRVDLDDPLYCGVEAFVALLLLYAVAQVVGALFQLELGRGLAACGRAGAANPLRLHGDSGRTLQVGGGRIVRLVCCLFLASPVIFSLLWIVALQLFFLLS